MFSKAFSFRVVKSRDCVVKSYVIKYLSSLTLVGLVQVVAVNWTLDSVNNRSECMFCAVYLNLPQQQRQL